ncbi:MAG: tetratricopeptide repeat protein [Candidatus Sumerlaeia bacterium]
MRKYRTIKWILMAWACMALVLGVQAQDDIKQQYDDMRKQMQQMERERPVPIKDIERLLNEALSPGMAPKLSAGQKAELVGIALSAKKRADGNDKALAMLEKLTQSPAFEAEGKANLRLMQAEMLDGDQKYQEAIQLAESIAQDEQARPMQRGQAYMQLAKSYSDVNEPKKMAEYAEMALEQYDNAAADANFGYHTVNDIKWAGAQIRDTLLDYDKAMRFFSKMQEYTEGDYWAVPSDLEVAATLRKQGEYAKASDLYDSIAELEDKRYSSRALMPKAEMILYDMDNEERGLMMMQRALESDEIHTHERYRALLRLAKKMSDEGKRNAALEWYANNLQLPGANERDVNRFSATIYLEMGRLYQSMGKTEKAKEMYRKARDLEGGEMSSRVQARDAIEDIEYFE